MVVTILAQTETFANLFRNPAHMPSQMNNHSSAPHVTDKLTYMRRRCLAAAPDNFPLVLIESIPRDLFKRCTERIVRTSEARAAPGAYSKG